MIIMYLHIHALGHLVKQQAVCVLIITSKGLQTSQCNWTTIMEMDDYIRICCLQKNILTVKTLNRT